MKLLVFLVDTACRPINWFLSRADRNVCRWSNETGDES